MALTLLGDDPALTQRTLQSIADNYILQNVARKSEEAEKKFVILGEPIANCEILS